MVLLWFLILGNILGGIIASWSFILNKTSTLIKYSAFIDKIKLPFGIIILLISFINIFNFGAVYYPKLSLLGGILVGAVLSVKLIKKTNLSEEAQNKIIGFAHNIQIISGLFSIIIGFLRALQILLQAIAPIL